MIKFENVNVTMQGKRILSDINLEIQDEQRLCGICARYAGDQSI